jgi:hypothetical protein
LRLPTEIRERIWALAATVDRVQVYKTDHLEVNGYLRYRRGGGGGAVLTAPDGSVHMRHPDHGHGACCPVRERSAFRLPAVSRQIYMETATLAYSMNIFRANVDLAYSGNWAMKRLMLAHRNAVTAVEMDEELLRRYIFAKAGSFIHTVRTPHSLRSRAFRNLTHVHISLHTQKAVLKGLRQRHWSSDYDAEAHEWFKVECEKFLKGIEGLDLVVVFQTEA